MFCLWRPERVTDVLVAGLLLLAVHQGTGAALIKAKAWLAPVLIDRAWARTLDGEVRVKPWPWADTWPVARLSAPDHAVDLLVLAGDSGNALAFGPGHALVSAPPGAAGLTVIGGHRDTHFAFLEHVRAGERVQLALPDGGYRQYRVSSADVVDIRHGGLAPQDSEALLLVTCFPFDALMTGGPLRWVVRAEPELQTEVTPEVLSSALL